MAALPVLFPAFAKSSYLCAGSEIIWIGSRDGTMHPRSVLVEFPRTRWAGPQYFDLIACQPWYPQQPGITQESLIAFVARCGQLVADIEGISVPVGFGPLLKGKTPDFPLDRCVSHAQSLVLACRRNDPTAAYDAALPLLGVGSGLTPSGDDFVSAALFGRRLLMAHTRVAAAWDEVTTRLATAVRSRSHIISATLFEDTATGCGFAPVHRLVVTLASGAPWSEVTAAARAMARIGHSSGWDMLAGLIAGVTGALGTHEQQTGKTDG